MSCYFNEVVKQSLSNTRAHQDMGGAFAYIARRENRYATDKFG